MLILKADCKFEQMIIEDEDLIPSKMNEEEWKAGNFAYNLRVSLFKEHFGMTDQELQDPICDRFWERAIGVAQVNHDTIR